MKKIIVVFKTHLDIGFTDFAQKVTENYMANYLPDAMKVASRMWGKKKDLFHVSQRVPARNRDFAGAVS